MFFFFLSWSAAVVSTERGIHVPALWKALQAAVKCCDHTKARNPPYLMLLTAACSGGRSDSSRSSSSSYRYMHNSRNNIARGKKKRTEERVNALTRKTIISYELSRWYLYWRSVYITNKKKNTHSRTHIYWFNKIVWEIFLNISMPCLRFSISLWKIYWFSQSFSY